MKKAAKRLLAASMVITMLICGLPINAQAAVAPPTNMELVSKSTEFLDNGITVITTIHEQETHQSEIAATAATYSKTGKITHTAMSGSTVMFSFSVSGTFTVDPGVSAICTASSCDYTINDSAWSLDSASASKSGNKATATGTFKKTLLFITVDTVILTPVLTCDVNGNLS